MNGIAQLEFELAYFEATVQYISHNATASFAPKQIEIREKKNETIRTTKFRDQQDNWEEFGGPEDVFLSIQNAVEAYQLILEGKKPTE